MPAFEPEGCVSWDVVLPDRDAPRYGWRPLKAKVMLETCVGEETWSVPMAVGRKLASLRKSRGGELGSRAELAYEVRKASKAAGRRRLESLLNKRDYSSAELKEKLASDGYSIETTDALIAAAVSGGAVNDARFADVFIRSKIYAGWGRQKIERELSRKGVEAESIPGWPEEYFEEGSELERARELASRRRPTGKNDFQKTVRYLCNKGFSMNIAIDAAKSALDQS